MKKIQLLLLSILLFSFVNSSIAQNRFSNNTNKTTTTNTVDNDKYIAPKEYEIGGIAVVGGTNLDENVIISISGLKKGDKITIPGDPKLGESIQKLWKQGILSDVQISYKIEKELVFLTIHIKERPRVTRYNFFGINKSEKTSLDTKVNTMKGKTLTDVLLKNTQFAIKKYYADKGFANAEVNIETELDTLKANSAYLKIKIDKNKKVKIELINIEGNTQISDKKLKKKMKGTKDLKGFKPLSASKFIESKYEADKVRIIEFYNNNGYRDARIISDSVYKVGKNRVAIDIRLEESKKYYFRNITWTGNYLYSNEILGKVLDIKKGDVYDVERLEKKLTFSQTEADISSLYMDNGYLFFRVDPIEIAIIGDSIDVEMQMYEGPQATINKIILNGNTKTSDHVVLREIRTTPGQKFSRADLIRSQREISSLGYFDPEKVDINPIPHPENGTVDIEYNVEEKPSDQIELSGGWGGAFGFVGTLGLVFNNFSIKNIANFKKWRPLPSGDGQRLQLRFQANGRAYQTYSLSFTEPWMGGKKPHSFTVSLSHSIQRTIISGQTLGSFKLYSVSATLGRRLRWPDDYFTMSNALIYSYYDLFNFGGSLGFSTGTSQSLVFNTTFARNSIDNPTFPRGGSSMSLSIALTPPWSLFEPDKNYAALSAAEKYRFVEYHKWMFDCSWFTTLVGKLVLNTRMHFGYIGAYNSKLGTGPFERFILGGAGLSGFNFLLGTEIVALRGYKDNSITPVESTQGGVIYNKYVMELRYPISLNPSATIFVTAFLEGGNNWGAYADYSPFKIYRTAGIGARVFMPAFGLLGIDWAYGFDEVPGRPGVNGAQFHFTIGQQIR